MNYTIISTLALTMAMTVSPTQMCTGTMLSALNRQSPKSWVRLLIGATLHNNPGQVVHTLVLVTKQYKFVPLMV